MRISKRCQNIKGSVTLEIDAKAKEMKAQGLDVVGFGAGEPDFDTPEHIRQAAKEALDKGMTRYTPASGTMDLKKAICEKFLRDKGMTVSPANRQLFQERVVKRSTPEQLGARPGDYARLQALVN